MCKGLLEFHYYSEEWHAHFAPAFVKGMPVENDQRKSTDHILDTFQK